MEATELNIYHTKATAKVIHTYIHANFCEGPLTPFAKETTIALSFKYIRSYAS